MTGQSKLQHALDAAARGFRIFPVTINGKTPFIPAWQDRATSDPGQISQVWSVIPRFNIGCFNLDVFTVDIDVAKGKQGLESWARLQERHGACPRTYTQRTPSGGLHVTFRSTPEIVATLKTCANALAGYPGVDVRSGRTGYVVGAGSSLPNGEYTVEDDAPIAEAPQWLIDILPKIHDRRSPANANGQPLVELDTYNAAARAIDYLENHAPEAIEGQGGDNTTIQVANRVGDFGISADKCRELMLDNWNDTKAIPPWDADELTAKVASAYKSRQNSVGISSAEAEFEAVEIDARKPVRGGWQEPNNPWEQDAPPSDLKADSAPDYVLRFAADRAMRIGVDAGAVAAATITALGSLIPAGNSLQMRQQSDKWAVKCVLWTAIIGDPGTAKSPAVAAAMAFPNALEREWRADFAKAQKEFEAAQPKTAGKGRRRAKAITANDATTPDGPPVAPDFGSADQFAEIDAVPPLEPKLRRKTVNDATTEALCSVLAATPESAPVLYHSDELAGWLGGMDAYRSRGAKDRPMFLAAKDAGAYAVDRKSTGTLVVPSLAISILGTIQDDKLSRIARDLTDDGLLQRFATVMIRKTGRGQDFPDDAELDNSVARVATALADLGSATYRLDPLADAELRAIEDFVEIERGRLDVSPALKTWISKAPNEFGRYCLAFHLIEWAQSIKPILGVEPAPLVSAETAARARRYVQEFLYGHAGYVYSTVMAKGVYDTDAQWVAGYILTRDLETITAREIGRAYRSLRGAEKRARLRSVMATLEQHDWVKLVDDQRGKWSINPMVHDGRFAAAKDEETARRAAVKAEIAATVDSIRSARGER